MFNNINMYSFVVMNLLILELFFPAIKCVHVHVRGLTWNHHSNKNRFAKLFDRAEFPTDGAIPMLNRKVFKAKRVSIREHPYVVSIRRNVAHYSVGCILTKNVVLTVAFPLIKVPITELTVVVGENYADRGSMLHTVILIIEHENFNPFTLENDIAMLRIFEDITFKGSAKAIPLMNDIDMIYGRKAFVTGWGRCDRTGKELCLPRSTRYTPDERLDPMLRTVTFTVQFGNKYCDLYQRNEVPLAPGMLCLGESRQINPVMSCLAVPGAPLAVGARLGAILSWGFGCCHLKDLPLIYTDVQHFHPILWYEYHSRPTRDRHTSCICFYNMIYVNILGILLISSSFLWPPTNFSYIRAIGSQRRLYFKIVKVMKEIVIDAIVKVQKVQFVKETYYKSNVFQMASETFYVKETFRKMLVKFNRTKQNMTVQTLSDNTNHNFINAHIRACVEMQHMRSELDNVRKMFEKFAIRSEPDPHRIHKRKQRLRIQRRNDKNAVKNKVTINKEREVDSFNKNRRIRERYLERLNEQNRRESQKGSRGIPTIPRNKPIKRKWLPGKTT